MHACSIMSATRAAVRSGGVLSLWTGLEASLYRSVPGVALYFTSITIIRNILTSHGYVCMLVCMYACLCVSVEASPYGSIPGTALYFTLLIIIQYRLAPNKCV